MRFAFLRQYRLRLRGAFDRRAAEALTVAVCGFLLLTNLGAAAAHAAPGRDKAWFDAKSVCVFPLGAGSMPHDSQQLVDSLAEGWTRSIVLPDPARAVSIAGGAFPAITALTIDLSEGQLRTGRKKEKIKLSNRVEENLDVDRLEVRGQPLLLHHAKLNMSITATAAQLSMERDKKGRPLMMLANARSGTLDFDVSQKDVETLLLQNARETASKYGITVESTKVKLTPETPRSVQASLHISTKVAFIPAGMLFRAHVVVDDAMNAKITGLTVDGDEALGPIIVGLLRPALSKYNGQTRPLVSFPAGSLQLRDVAIRVDDSLHLTAKFGS